MTYPHVCLRPRPRGALPALLLALLCPHAARAAAPPMAPPTTGGARPAALGSAEVWKRLPRAVKGAGRPLPVWARALAPTLPQTTAAMLELDYLHRARSPLAPRLRARVRWVAAHAVGCAYGERYAAADLLRAGGTPEDVRALAGDHAGLPAPERAALAFARALTLDPHSVTDEQVARLVRLHGEKQVVALVLLLAWANFQDRLLLALGLPLEADGPLPPAEVRFAPPPLGASLAVPRKGPPDGPAPPARAAAPEWRNLSYAALQKEIEKQRSRKPRIRLPEGGPGVIRWGQVCRTYQPELAAAWAVCRERFGAEANQDAVFEASLFWVFSREQRSFY